LVGNLQTTKYFQKLQVAVGDDNNNTDLRTISIFIFWCNFFCWDKKT